MNIRIFIIINLDDNNFSTKEYNTLCIVNSDTQM